jgi:single-stranded-DNA-specific exonuclease
MTPPRFFLDVETSLTGRSWRARLDAAGEARALAISQISGRGDLLARILTRAR